MFSYAPGADAHSRRYIEIGVVAGAVALAVLVGNALWHDGAIHNGDPLSFLRVARDPFGSGAGLEADAAIHGVSYRYGRILFPLAAWLLAAGNADYVDWTLPLVSTVAFGACAVAAAALADAAGQPRLRGLSVVAVPTLITPTVLVYGEAVAFALLLGAYALYLRGNRRAAWMAAALVPLAREALVVALVPLAVRHLRTHGADAMRPVAAAIAPLAVWYTWVRWRVGEFPFLDPSVSRREALGIPFVGAAQAISESPAFVLAVLAVLTAAVAVVTFGAAVIVVLRHPKDRLLSTAALLMAALGLCLGAQAYRYPIDGLRVLAPGQVLLAVVWARNGRPTAQPEADEEVDLRELEATVAA